MWLDKGISYLSKGLDVIRNIVDKIAGVIPAESTLVTTLIFFLISLWLGWLIAKRFVTKPFQIPYLFYYLIIVVLIFLNLVYL